MSVSVYGASPQRIVNISATDTKSKWVKSLDDLPPPDGAGKIKLDKNDQTFIWIFSGSVDITPYTLIGAGVTICGSGAPNSEIISNAPGKPLIENQINLDITVCDLKLQNTAAGGSIFNLKGSNDPNIAPNCKIENITIITCKNPNLIKAFDFIQINSVRIVESVNGGFVFGGLTDFSFRVLKMSNIFFEDGAVRNGDCIYVDNGFAPQFLICELNDCYIHSPVDYYGVNLKSTSNIGARLLIDNTFFAGPGGNTLGFNSLSQKVTISQTCEGVTPSPNLFYAIYEDSTTQSFPIAAAEGVWTKLTNDASVVIENLPSTITALWDSVVNKIKLDEVNIGESMSCLVSLGLEVSKLNTVISFRLFGLDVPNTIIGGDTIEIINKDVYQSVTVSFNFVVSTADIQANGFEIQLSPLSPALTSANIKVNSIQIKRG